MLKDIKNVMSPKRPCPSDFSPQHASLLDAMSGKKYVVTANEEFVIGRSLACSIIVEEIYISRRHCVIKYENNQFVIYDNNTCSGTYLNCERLPKGKTNSVVLKSGDLIGFGDKKKLEFIYKFCLHSNAEKRLKLDIYEKVDTAPEVKKLEENYKKSLRRLHSKVLDLKVEKMILHNTTKTQVLEFKKNLSTAVDCQISTVNKLTEKITEYQRALELQQELSVESFKNQVHDILENDFQCPICNEVLIKASLTHTCGHTFCGSCITKWLSKNKICPVCRASVQATTDCLTLDNFITNLCNLIGGAIKQQREDLQKERVIVGPSSRRGRKRTNTRRRPETYPIDLPDLYLPLYNQINHTANLYPAMRAENIEVVDLTHNMSR